MNSFSKPLNCNNIFIQIFNVHVSRRLKNKIGVNCVPFLKSKKKLRYTVLISIKKNVVSKYPKIITVYNIILYCYLILLKEPLSNHLSYYVIKRALVAWHNASLRVFSGWMRFEKNAFLTKINIAEPNQCPPSTAAMTARFLETMPFLTWPLL